MLTNMLRKAIQKAPEDLFNGFLDLIKAPPEKALEVWDGVSEEDKDRIINVIRTTADLYIKYGNKAAGGKITF